MRTLFSRSFGQVTIAFALACLFMPVRADESAERARALLADDAPGMQQGNRFIIVPVAVPQPRSSDKTSVTLWDEIPPPSPLPLPVPRPAPHPGDAQHAMEEKSGNGVRR
ncbi:MULTISPECIES: hypothetical protein [unclassified Burkholderia]|uniref:hypothetical protein n=1 Tax=unclassified Burkholderia TaxID=2613784 RepID=UPI000F55D87F|nr:MULTISPECIES: hypothetical protein [unclassified Burkholderia]RQR31352.1 hypothetical protein DIE22_22465 [Burkholderia sp. Bp9142]RQR48054.1 hypothetical protein DIE21_24700 [Burkholderia sp. Bp9140]